MHCGTATPLEDLRKKVASTRLDQDDREMEVVVGDENWEFDLHRHFKDCQKNPGHNDFIPVNDLDLENLPEDCRNLDLLGLIKERCNETVKLTIRYTCPERPDDDRYTNLKGTTAMRTGTGVFSRGVSDILTSKLGGNQPCPFEDCPVSKDPHSVSPYLTIFTAAHVVFNDSEAKTTLIEFYYDDDKERSGVVKAEGVEVKHVDAGGDLCLMTCVSHDLTLVDKLKSHETAARDSAIPLSSIPTTHVAFVISHPHGCSKYISFGHLINTDVVGEFDPLFLQTINGERKDDGRRKVDMGSWCTFQYKIATCPGSSGAPVHVIQAIDGKGQQIFAPHSRHSQESKLNKSGLGAIWHLASK